MSSNISLDALKSHLFETLEGLKNLNDPEASENEKVSIEQAKAITDVSGKIIDIYKTQLEGVKTVASLASYNDGCSILNNLGVAEARQLEAR